jgi:hypothetical protein
VSGRASTTDLGTMGRASGRSIRHDIFGHLYLCTIIMVLASVIATSFTILFLLSFPSCLCLPATPFSVESVGVGASSLSHSMHVPSFSPSSDVPFVFPAFAMFFFPNLLPPAHGRRHEPANALRRGYGVSRSCSWPFFVHAAEEDTMAPATLRLSWR